MSELFNALEKLEGQNTSKTPQLPPLTPEAEKGGEKKSIPYLKSMILFALIMIVTVVGFFVVSSGQVQIFLSEIGQGTPSQQKTVIPTSDIRDQAGLLETDDDALPVAAAVEINILPIHVAGTEEEGQQEERGTSRSLVPMGERKSDQIIVPTQNEGTREELEYSEDNNSRENDISQELEALATVLAEKQRRQARREFTGKRLLRRAETLRNEGKTAQALTMYKKAWRNNPDAAIANNIGAILIGMHSYLEAVDYLNKALLLAPDDPDIIFNIKIAQEGRK